MFEAAAAAAASLIVAGVLVDAGGMPVNPTSVGTAALVLMLALAVPAWRAWRSARRQTGWIGELALAVVAVVAGYQLLLPAWPDLLPLGNSVDAAHHLALANYVLDHQQLVRDPAAVKGALGELADYPPGLALLVALLAEAAHRPPVAVVYPLAAAAVVASIVGVALLIAEAAPRALRFCALLALLPLVALPDYALGAIANQSYYPQVLGQALIVAAGVALARYLRRPSLGRSFYLALLLLALDFTYTLWAPVALLAVVLAHVTLTGFRRQALLRWAMAVAPAAGALLLYGIAHAGAASAVVQTEGSTVRALLWDPLLPLIALASLLVGWRQPARRAALALVVAAAGQSLAFWLGWQRGLLAGYIFFKTLYLLALLVPVPIAWLALDVLAALGRRWPARGRNLSSAPVALIGLVGCAGVLYRPGLAEPASRPLSPALIEAGRWIQQHMRPSEVALSLGGPGLPAYWLSVGVLNQPRPDAERLLREPRLEFTAWYFDPAAPRAILLDQPVAPGMDEGLRTSFRSDCCVILEKTGDYQAALQRHKPLLVRYRAEEDDGRVRVDLEVYDAANQPNLSIGLAMRTSAGSETARRLPVPVRPNRAQYLGFTLNPASAKLTAYANHEPGQTWPGLPVGVGAEYEVRLQLASGDTVGRELPIATCRQGEPRCKLSQTGGVWTYFLPSAHTQPLAAQQLGLGEHLDLVASSTVQTAEAVTVRLRWQARAAIERGYRVFVQLIAADGGAAVSVEGEPNGAAAPTWRWQAGDTVDDEWTLRLRPDLQPGTYTVVAGMYDPRNGQRLDAWRRQPYLERFWSGALPIGTVTITR